MARIGFVGLGHMGLPMAINLLHAGHEVTGFDLNQEAMAHFSEHKGVAARTLQELAHGQDVLITMLQNGQQVLEVYAGGDGLTAHANPGTLLIDCSTIDVSSAHAFHQTAANQKMHAVDAPVSGGVAGAAAATLTFMVGGDDAAYTAAQPILSHMGQKIIHTGGAGSGQAAKICNNMILGISMVAISEAFTLAKHLGLAPQKLFEVVTNASGQCWAMSKYVPVPGILEHVPANQDYKPGFAAAMMLKDLRLSQDSAALAQVMTPVAAKTTELYQQFIDMGYGATDFSAIIKLIAEFHEV